MAHRAYRSRRTPPLTERNTAHHHDDQVENVLERFPEIVHVGLAVYTEDGLRAFLTTPMERFDGRSGIELIRDGKEERVLSALASDYEGLG